MAYELTWKNAIIKVLEKSSTPLNSSEITELIVSDGLRKSLGATPIATVSAQISSSIKHKGKNSPYVRVAKGLFNLREKDKTKTKSTNSKYGNKIEQEKQDELDDIVSSFGMYWSRNEIEWAQTPKLLGIQKIGATPVDFNKQLGIYLLYDGREVIYVGRTTDRPLGRRLYEHTIDRLSSRWDRFSWFGLLPVSSSGALGKFSDKFISSKLIPTMEAILIEALEPRQNRKRGDDISSVEYMQKIDPEIEKKKVKEFLVDRM